MNLHRSSKSPRIAILVPRDYWTRRPQAGNGADHRSVPHICSALRKAGARPEWIFPDSSRVVGDFDALVLPGGGDIDPRFYGQEVGPGVELSDLRPDWDEFQLGWARTALEQGLPMLGICRGMQLINVASGGTLIQDLPSWGTPLDHACNHVISQPQLRALPVHNLRVASGSRLEQLWGQQELQVNSIHHQAVDRIATGWEAVALAEDGVIEAIERAQAPWQRGVQFHPEDMLSQAPFQALFDQLVEDARS